MKGCNPNLDRQTSMRSSGDTFATWRSLKSRSRREAIPVVRWWMHRRENPGDRLSDRIGRAATTRPSAYFSITTFRVVWYKPALICMK
jgi:hypothetical protein